jgi:hypothetical protein
MTNRIPRPMTLDREGRRLVDWAIDTIDNRMSLTQHPNLRALCDYLDEERRMVVECVANMLDL